MAFVEMDSSLSEDDANAGDLAQNKTSRVAGHSRRRNFFVAAVGNGILGRVGHDRPQTGSKNDRSLRVPIAQTLADVAHAAETGGAEAGFFVEIITSGRKVSSRGCRNFDSALG